MVPLTPEDSKSPLATTANRMLRGFLSVITWNHLFFSLPLVYHTMRVYAIWSYWSAGGFLNRVGGGGAQWRFFHGFALSTHLWFEDCVNDGFVAVVGGQRTLILPVVLLGRQMVVTPYQNAEISVRCWRLM